MTVRLEPLEDRMVVEPIEGESKDLRYASGLHKIEQAKDVPQEAVVVQVGPGRVDAGVLVPMHVKVGDIVLHGKFSGLKIPLDDDEFLILRQTDVIAIVHRSGADGEQKGPSHLELLARGDRDKGAS